MGGDRFYIIMMKYVFMCVLRVFASIYDEISRYKIRFINSNS